MTPAEQKMLNESLSKLFKTDSEILASLYNEAGELSDFSKILELDAERIREYKTASDNQYKRGIKEGASKIEKEIKEKYELESDLVGVDLIDDLVVKKIEAASQSHKDITKHPDYIKLQVSIDKQLKERDKEWESKLTEREKEFNKAKLFDKVRERALSSLDSRKPILPSDPRIAQTWKETYLNALKSGNYMEDGENIIVLDAEGKPLQTAHGKPVTFDEYEKDVASRYFEYPIADSRSSAGNKEPASGNIGMPKTEEEYIARQRDPKITPQERIKLTEYWLNKQ